MFSVINRLRNMFKKKLIIISSILILVLSIIGLLDYCLFSPSPINKFIASNIYKTPANSAFTDDNFYQCVVDAYNEKNKTNVGYTTNLSDEQLESITVLSCYDMGVVNTDGLEKMVSLVSIWINKNEITSIDLSNNNLLSSAYLTGNKLKTVITNNENLTNLSLADNLLEEIDVSKNVNLKTLDLGGFVYFDYLVGVYRLGSGNFIKEIDISKNINLEKI